MLRHLKMELKRQQADNSLIDTHQQVDRQEASHLVNLSSSPPSGSSTSQKTASKNSKPKQQNRETMGVLSSSVRRRVRARRSSKPLMEKRRRARINECLDILKSYVLTDATNLGKLGVDMSGNENRNEENMAKTILKSSGLINRHNGRKNLNKLEKADILELTVNYVRHLHEQRDNLVKLRETIQDGSKQLLSTPLMVRVGIPHPSPTVPSPPPSSASSSPQPLLSIVKPGPISTSDVLDLSRLSKRSKLL